MAGPGTVLFAMLSGTRKLVGSGIGTVLPRGPAETLGARVRAYFRDHPIAPLLAGAIPFDRSTDDYLVAPATLEQDLVERGSEWPSQPGGWSVREEPPAEDYAEAVSHVLRSMAGGRDLRKVVLARSLLVMAGRPIDMAELLRRLHAADRSVMAFLVPLPQEQDGAPRHLVGATPELLVSRTGSSVSSHPLAGSARRSPDAAHDEAARLSLTASGKDMREHALVAEFIMDTLAPYCSALIAPYGTEICATGTMWHLGTCITGTLRDLDQSAADLAAILHPTPAVCGVPRNRAAALIQELEPVGRGFYAGAVGWCDRSGDGVWHVAIRCAEIAGCQVRLYAGAGIVPGSDPAAEVRETAAKFYAMLNALGIDA